MKHCIPLLWIVLNLLVTGVEAVSQTAGAENEAWQLAQEGRNLIASGDFSAAAEKFSRATKLSPDKPDYQLGLAHALFFLKDYPGAMRLCQPLMVGKAAEGEAFQVYGNCLDAQGKSYEALETYRKGLKRFPDAGMLYMEMGIVEYGRHRDTEALRHWERGILAQPTFPSNYYFAAQRLIEQGDYAWAANYAELFINLERTGDRVREMSKLLMAAHERARHFDYVQAFQWRFFQTKDTATGLPLPSPLYQQLLDAAFASELTDTMSKLSIAQLAESRRFVCHWLPKQLPDNPAAGLMEWQQLITQMGHMEAYHYWMLYDARPEEFMSWYAANKALYERFEGWYLRNTFHRHIKRGLVRPAPDREDNKR